MEAHAFYRLLGTHFREARSLLDQAADEKGVDVYKLVDKAKDTVVDARKGTLRLEWPVIAPLTGAPFLLYTTMAVNLTRTLEQLVIDRAEPMYAELTMPEGAGIDGVDLGGEKVTLRLSEFDNTDVVVKRMGDRVLRQDGGAQVIVNVPEQPAPVVNVTLANDPIESHQDVRFVRDGRNQLVGATVDGIEQPAA